MRKMTVKELMDAIEGKLIQGSEEKVFERVVTDSRETGPEDVFFALKGDFNDGHDYLGQVLDSGCRVIAVCDEEKAGKVMDKAPEASFVLVKDTKRALQILGAYYLDSLDLKVKIGVTGSVGKTSTRDFIYYVMSQKYRTARSIKNFNNSFGLPLSLLSFPDDSEAAVIELGMDGKGTIGVLTDLVRPDIGVLTNVGISHIENFPEEGREGILKTKLEIAQNFTDDSVLIINADNDMLHNLDLKERGIKGRLIRVGTDDSCDYVLKNVEDKGIFGISFDLEHEGKSYHVDLPVPGAHNAINAGFAIACGHLNGIETEDAIEGFGKAELTGSRLNIKKTKGLTLIDDTYNAAPDSVKSAINTLMATPVEGGGRRIAVLGDMAELGSEAERGHREVGEHAFEKGVDVMIAIGELSMNALQGWKEKALEAGHSVKKACEQPLIFIDEETGRAAEHFDKKETVIEGILDHVHEGDCILLKASRFMALEKIVEHIMK